LQPFWQSNKTCTIKIEDTLPGVDEIADGRRGPPKNLPENYQYIDGAADQFIPMDCKTGAQNMS
jgi:hypothetical protein